MRFFFGFFFALYFQLRGSEYHIAHNRQIIEQIEMLKHHSHFSAGYVDILKMLFIERFNRFIELRAFAFFKQIVYLDIFYRLFVALAVFRQFAVSFRLTDHIEMQIRVDGGKEFTFEPDFAVGRSFEQIHTPQTRRFAAARRSDYRDFFTFFYLQ
ncbi:unknown [Acidiphilium sp. CAG:727]|nr:unknown [Acidiphilium sp. CAG:727]